MLAFSTLETKQASFPPKCRAQSVIFFISFGVFVVVHFYHRFKIFFLLFLGMVMYDNNMIRSLKQKKRNFEPRIKLNHNMYIYMYVFLFFFVGEKVSYRYIISFFEKSSNLDSMKLRPTNVCLWKSTRTVLHSKYPFCSKDANQTGNTSSLLVHCLKQYLAINCSNG